MSLIPRCFCYGPVPVLTGFHSAYTHAEQDDSQGRVKDGICAYGFSRGEYL